VNDVASELEKDVCMGAAKCVVVKADFHAISINPAHGHHLTRNLEMMEVEKVSVLKKREVAYRIAQLRLHSSLHQPPTPLHLLLPPAWLPHFSLK